MIPYCSASWKKVVIFTISRVGGSEVAVGERDISVIVGAVLITAHGVVPNKVGKNGVEPIGFAVSQERILI